MIGVLPDAAARLRFLCEVAKLKTANLVEAAGTTLDNLNRAERLGSVAAAEARSSRRQLRNRLVHGYVREPALLADGLNAAHGAVPMLLGAAARIVG